MRNYRLLTLFISPLIPLWLIWRSLSGKEDRERLRERFGKTSVPRPTGTLLWLHAASVGEANSVLLLIQKIRERFPHIKVLITTGTVTAARLMQIRLPKHVIHQYAPVDTPQATRRFMRHWRPDIAFWIESEFWPNMVMTAHAHACFMGVINARMSQRSLQRWQKHPQIIETMLDCFNIIVAQTEEDAIRLRTLGARDVTCVGNLKFDAALLPCDEAELVKLKTAIGLRPVWLAASTHPGEEMMVAQAHGMLVEKRPHLLTIIVPRHPERGSEIVSKLKKYGHIMQRAKREPISAGTDIYIADTMGELGLFYRLSEIVFMGGSLVNHGGQNPLEAARLSCAIVSGPHTHNFSDIYSAMEKAGGCLRVTDGHDLGMQVGQLFSDSKSLEKLQNAGQKWVESQGGAAERLLDMLAPVFTPEKK